MFKVYFLSTLNLTSKISTFHLKVHTSQFSISKESYQTPTQNLKTGVIFLQFPGNGFDFGIIGKDF